MNLPILLAAVTIAVQSPCPEANRSGYRGQVAWWARSSSSSSYAIGQVGGGALCGGDGPGRSDGTWGRDYVGGCAPYRIFLGWSQGRLYQGGSGAYATDGPRLGNVLQLTPLPTKGEGKK